MIEYIKSENCTLAIIIKNNYSMAGIKFFTDLKDSQQLGYMNRPKFYKIQPHRHNINPREVNLTQEVIFVKSGKVRVDFYDNFQNYLKSRILEKGDVILLAEGGHGFTMLENSELIEVKQGPYNEINDKVRFNAITDDNLKFD